MPDFTICKETDYLRSSTGQFVILPFHNFLIFYYGDMHILIRMLLGDYSLIVWNLRMNMMKLRAQTSD